jgi:hypothetical protein
MKRKRPKLKPLKLTDEDLDRLSVTTEQDIIKANNEWNEHAKMKGLLEAIPEEEEIN